MRKIVSKHEERKKRKRNQIVLSLILVFIMFSSILGFAFQTFGGHSGNNPSRDDYVPETTNFNGFEFSEQNGFWILDFNGMNLIFRYNPSQILKIKGEINSLLSYEAKTLYIYSESVQAKSEVRTNLFEFVDGIENACLDSNSECKDQVRTCEDNFIIIQEKDEQEIRQQNNCVFISGLEKDLTKLTDEFLYKILGVA